MYIYTHTKLNQTKLHTHTYTHTDTQSNTNSHAHTSKHGRWTESLHRLAVHVTFSSRATAHNLA
jgi:hypothetical protein